MENAFGILADFWCLLTTLATKPVTTTKMVKACLCLHNLMWVQYPNLQNANLDGEDDEGVDVPRAWWDAGFLAEFCFFLCSLLKLMGSIPRNGMAFGYRYHTTNTLLCPEIFSLSKGITLLHVSGVRCPPEEGIHFRHWVEMRTLEEEHHSIPSVYVSFCSYKCCDQIYYVTSVLTRPFHVLRFLISCSAVNCN